MRIAIILGAGASLAHAEHFRPQRGKDRNPPLDYTFFEKVRALKIGVPDELRKYARRVPPQDPFDPTGSQPRMEEFLKDLYYDLLDVPGDFAIRKAYTELVELYVRVLRETTNWMCGRSRRGGPIGRLLATAAEEAANPAALNSLGIKAMETGDYATAQALLSRAVAADPRAIPLWMNLAKAQP